MLEASDDLLVAMLQKQAANPFLLNVQASNSKWYKNKVDGYKLSLHPW